MYIFNQLWVVNFELKNVAGQNQNRNLISENVLRLTCNMWTQTLFNVIEELRKPFGNSVKTVIVRLCAIILPLAVSNKNGLIIKLH